MLCLNPECKSPDIYVVNTWKYPEFPDSIIRMRGCHNCGTIWKTYESPDKNSVQIGYMNEIEPELGFVEPTAKKTTS